MNRPGLMMAGGLMLLSSHASAECKLGTMYFDLNQVTTVELQATSGEYCASQFRIPRLVITRAAVLEQPKNGLVNFDQKTFEWKYRPFPRFKGEDTFVLRIHGYNDRRNGDGTVVFKVRVQ